MALERKQPEKKESPKEFTRSDIRQYLTKPNVELSQKTGLSSDRRGGLEKKWFGSEHFSQEGLPTTYSEDFAYYLQ